MILALSSQAAPRASLSELIKDCSRRGIYALHLVDGHAHGLSLGDPGTVSPDVLSELQAHGAAVVTFEAGDALNEILPEIAAETCARLHARLLVDDPATEWCRDFVRTGGNVVPRFELNPANANVFEAFSSHTGRVPSHIILRGGGPEAARFEGRGIGSLMARLTLSSYQGAIVLAPSDQAVLPVWSTWLRQGRSWGCGSKESDPSLVQLR